MTNATAKTLTTVIAALEAQNEAIAAALGDSLTTARRINAALKQEQNNVDDQ